MSHEQAKRRASALSVEAYSVELDLSTAETETEREFTTITTIRLRVLDEVIDARLDLDVVHLSRLIVDGESVPVSTDWAREGVPLAGLVRQGQVHELILVARCTYGNTGRGMHRAIDPVDGATYLHTQLQPGFAPRVFACFDQPDLKAPFEVTAIVPEGWTVFANAPESTVAEPAFPGSDVRRWRFARTDPLPPYLVAVVAGPFHVSHHLHRTGARSIPLRLACPTSLADQLDARMLFGETVGGINFFERLFGTEFPFPKYDQCFVPEFAAGGMENAACAVLSDAYLFRHRPTDRHLQQRAGTVLHELAHMWFGALVTMRWWDDLWLNEAFATWAGTSALAEFERYATAWTSFVLEDKARAYQEDASPAAHPIVRPTPNSASAFAGFDAITYAKGASVLRQLMRRVGERNFHAILAEYFRRYAWGNAELADFLNIAHHYDAVGDLHQWAAQWLETTGANVLRLSTAVSGDGTCIGAVVTQYARPAPRSHRVSIGIYDERPGDSRLIRTHRVEVDVQGPHVEIPELCGLNAGKLVVLNDDDMTYASVLLEPAALATVRARVTDIESPTTRTLCWATMWDMTVAGEFRACAFAELVRGTIDAEPDAAVVQRLLQQARTALDRYADPSASVVVWSSLTERLIALLHTAEPGSDHQLSYFQALLTSVLDRTAVSVVREFWDHPDRCPAPLVDSGMSPLLLLALIAHGEADEEDVARAVQAEEAGQDSTLLSKVIAARPDPESKRRAWETIVSPETSATLRGALMATFPHPAHSEVLAEFAPAYFPALESLGRRAPIETVQSFAMVMFPEWSVHESTVRLADEWLAEQHGQHLEAVRNAVLVGRSRVSAALVARSREAADRIAKGAEPDRC